MDTKLSSLEQILTNSASGMSAQSIRMNITASNIANAGSVSGDPDATYRARFAQFTEVKDPVQGLPEHEQPIGGVRVTGIQTSDAPLTRRYDPNNPAANEEGYIYLSDVNAIEEMTNMIDASREYQANVEVMKTTKNLIMQTVKLLESR